MADNKRELSIRLSAEGGADLTNTFKAVGDAGQAAFGQIDKASADSAAGLGQLDSKLADVAATAKQATTALQQQINGLVGIGSPSAGSAQSSADVFRYAAAQQAAQQAAALQAAQAQYNALLGVGQGGGNSAAASAAVFEEAAAAIKAETQAMAALDAEARQLIQRFDPLTAAETRYAAGIDSANHLLAAGKISLEQHEAALAGEEAALNTLRASLNNTGGSFRNLGPIVQQAGYQIGDFAVQVASGSGVLRPLIQQGTQLISAFGPWGAVIGAAGAVIGALTQAFIANKDAAEDTTKAVDAYREALQAADEITRKLQGDNQQTLDALDAERRYRLGVADAALQQAQAAVQAAKADLQKNANDELQATLTAGVDTSPAFAKANEQLAALKKQTDILLNGDPNNKNDYGLRGLYAEAAYGGQMMDGFAGQASSHASDYANPSSKSATSPRAAETKDIGDQASALAGLLDKMQDENTLLSVTGDARTALSRQREIDAAVTQAQTDAERDYQAGLRDTEILTADELKRVQDLAGAHFDLTTAEKASGAAAAAAAKTAAEALKQQQAVTSEVTGFIDQSFDRIGQTLTQNAVTTGTWSDELKNLGNVGLGVLSELEQEAFKLSVINPFKNWENGNSALPTIGDVIGKILGSASDGFGPTMGSGNTVTGMLGHAAGGGYIEVGENGPEKFYPGISGLVTPTGTSLASPGDLLQAANKQMAQPIQPSVIVQNIDQRKSGTVEQQRTTGPNGEMILRNFIRDAVSQQIAAGDHDRTFGQAYGLNRKAAVRR